MAFTGILGTSFSQLGSVVLGMAGGDPLQQAVISNVTVTQSATAFVPNIVAIADIVITQQVSLQMVRNLSVSSTVTPTQKLRRILELSVSNTITITQNRTGDRIKPTHSTIIITQSATVAKVLNRSVANTVQPVQGLARTLVINRSLQSTITPIENASSVHVKLLSASNTVTPTNNVVRERIEAASSNLINLSQSVSVRKVMHLSASSSIHITQNGTRNLVYNRTVSSTITMVDHRIVPYRIGGLTTILLPAVRFSKVHPAYMTLSVGNDIVTLPAPEFGDKIGNTDVFTMSMAKTGKIYTTVRRSPTKNFNYEWDLFASKAEELKDFLWKYNAEAIRVENWKGEIWFARLLTNPISFQDILEHWDWCGGKVTVALDFEGVRVH